jgi:hypothetical protein
MGLLMLRCPTTGRGFDAGVEIDETSFKRMSYFGRNNPDNFAMVDGERKYVGPPPNIVPHPTRGLPEWMR